MSFQASGRQAEVPSHAALSAWVLHPSGLSGPSHGVEPPDPALLGAECSEPWGGDAPEGASPVSCPTPQPQPGPLAAPPGAPSSPPSRQPPPWPSTWSCWQRCPWWAG